MARSYTTENVKSLILQYRQLQADLVGILERTPKENKSAIEKAATIVLNSKVLANSVVDDLRRGQSKVPKTFDTQALMSALYKQIHSASVVDLCLSLANEYNSTIQSSLQALQIVASSFRRFFAGSKAKAAAESAYDYLSSLESGIWGNTIRQSVEEIKRINTVSPASAFSDYENNPSAYYEALRDCATNTFRTSRPLDQVIPIIARHEALLEQYRLATLPNAKSIRVNGNRLMYSKASKALKGEAGWYIS